MRELYSLTDATKDTLAPNVKAVADGWRKSDKYVYQILGDEKTDPFAPFHSLYEGVLKAGVSTCHFDNELEFSRLRYERKKTRGGSPDLGECFKAKLNMHSKTLCSFIEAMSDGDLTDAEIKDLQICLDKEKRSIELIETMLNFRRSLNEKI